MSFKQSFGWLFLLLLALVPAGAAFQNWEQIAGPETTQPLSAALPHPFDPDKTLLASSSQIFEAQSGSRHWKKITPARTDIQIHRLYHFPQFPEQVFILADRGLYKFDLHRPGSWHSLRESRHGESLTSFAISPEEPGRWFLGSTFHLYESSDEGKTWRISSALSEDPVCFLKFSSGRLYAASHKTLYGSEDLSFFKKAFSLTGSLENGAEEELILDENEMPVSETCPFYDILADTKTTRLWTATTRGVFQSDDGESWKRLSQSGLSSLDIRYLAYAETAQALFAGTPEGLYRFSANALSWKAVYRPPARNEIKGLILDEAQNKIYGVTTRGFVSHPLLPDGIAAPPEWLDARKLFFQEIIRLEPSPREIYKAVVRSANTHNSKIKRWQAESRLRALLPNVSFGKDFSRGNNIDIDRGSTNDRDTFIEGPEDLSRGWDLSVSWDLGDVIFNSSQTSIDSREKLMVELRHDLTQEATRLYYERRRLQLEAALTPAATEQEHLQRLIQIEEITALVDSMTEGYLTQRLEVLYRERPELRKVWEYAPSGTQPG